MRSLWTGSIAFGLVNIPVRLFTAVRDNSIRFHMMSPNGECRLRQKLYCPKTKKEYDFGDTAKGYEVSPGEYVLIDQKELAKLQPEKGHSIDIVDFIQADEVDPIYFTRTYFLGPDKRAGKPYRLLLEVMKETSMVSVGRFVMRNKEYLCVIRPKDDVLLLDTLYFAEEVLNPKEIPTLTKEMKGVRVTPKELDMGVRLVGKMKTHFKPENYKDEYRDAVKKLLKAKAGGKKIALPDAPAKKSNVIDLMAALKQSVAGKKAAAKKSSSHRRAS